jgi:uncharacterized protein YutE (UPF0331/DUF86 family)
MINIEKVQSLLRSLETALNQLRLIRDIDQKDFLDDGLALGAGKYYLHTAIEACIDIGNHIISSAGLRAPRDYRDVFNVLEENDILSEQMAIKLRQMTGLRNRLVHLYWEVDDKLIFQYIQTNLDDFEQFIHEIVEILNRNTLK